MNIKENELENNEYDHLFSLFISRCIPEPIFILFFFAYDKAICGLDITERDKLQFSSRSVSI